MGAIVRYIGSITRTHSFAIESSNSMTSSALRRGTITCGTSCGECVLLPLAEVHPLVAMTLYHGSDRFAHLIDHAHVVGTLDLIRRSYQGREEVQLDFIGELAPLHGESFVPKNSKWCIVLAEGRALQTPTKKVAQLSPVTAVP
jgi:hypothetical protein